MIFFHSLPHDWPLGDIYFWCHVGPFGMRYGVYNRFAHTFPDWILSTQHQTEDISILWNDLATAHYAGATADLVAETEVPLVASEMNAWTSLSEEWDPLRISQVPNHDVYHSGWTASSDQILQARIVQNVKKMDPSQLQKKSEGARKVCVAGEPTHGEAYPWWGVSWQMFIICVLSFVVQVLKTPTWWMTWLCPIL